MNKIVRDAQKIDLHIHTVQSVSDHPFDFSIDSLESYVINRKIDCIAITNHNLFDKKQFDMIKEKINIIFREVLIWQIIIRRN